jgi:hypothetical protein
MQASSKEYLKFNHVWYNFHSMFAKLSQEGRKSHILNSILPDSWLQNQIRVNQTHSCWIFQLCGCSLMLNFPAFQSHALLCLPPKSVGKSLIPPKFSHKIICEDKTGQEVRFKVSKLLPGRAYTVHVSFFLSFSFSIKHCLIICC